MKYSIPDNIGIHGFADDYTLKDFFEPVVDEMDTIIGLEECLEDVKIWMDSNTLKMNDAKTEISTLWFQKTNTKMYHIITKGK